MSDDYIVDVHDLSKHFNGKEAVKDVSLKVKRGEIFGFLGPNGSGKTTTIRMLCGLMTPDSGSGLCLGYDITHEPRHIKYKVGYVPQAFSLYQDLTVMENLSFMARIYAEDDYASRVQNILSDLELTPYKNILAGKLSGGWKQRLSLGAALIHDPQLLLLDEPTAGVDPKARRDFWNYISLLTSKGVTALVSTHYMDEAERCNRLAYIVYGRLMVTGTITEIINQVGLITYATSGTELVKLSQALQNKPGIEQVVPFGNEVRISGKNVPLMQQTMKEYSSYAWHEVTTSLEAVFIHLLAERANKTEENAS